jgi:hypothetical protein
VIDRFTGEVRALRTPGWRPAAAAAAVAALALSVPVGAPPRELAAAPAATVLGADVSWPQCSVAQGGYALPMPPDDSRFVVIGLTAGLPFAANPCLADQVRWARDRGVPAHAYTVAAHPTNAEVRRHGTRGPWRATTLAGRLSNTGYAQGVSAVATARSVGLAPGVLWVDVEPRARQPWPTGTAAVLRNRAVLLGMLRALSDARQPTGVYSFASGWREITGGWRLPGLPVWATAGRSGRAAAAAMCGTPSFSGGPVHLAQWFDDVRDSDLTCPPYRQVPPVPYPPATVGDPDGALAAGWDADLLARDARTGVLWLHRRSGTGWRPRTSQGSGWRGYDVIDTPGDLTGDGVPDLLGRNRGTGDLWLRPRTAAGGWRPWVRVATGWSRYDTVLAPGDLTGDGVPDVAVRRAGALSVWEVAIRRGRPVLVRSRLVSTGWQGLDRITAPGDLTGDGLPDLLARQGDGLWLYPGRLTATVGGAVPGLRPRVLVGRGWSGYTALLAPGDVDRDGIGDLLGRDRAGTLWLHPGRERVASGAVLGRPVRLGTGWNAYDALS